MIREATSTQKENLISTISSIVQQGFRSDSI